MGGLEGLNEAVQQTHIWINDLDLRLAWDNKPRTYRLLKAVLHAVRDHLPVNEAVDLGAQLPTLVRGAYYEGWRPARTPVKDRALQAFLDAVDGHFRPDPIDDTEAATSVVFGLLSDKISAGEIADVRQALPRGIRVLWPDD